MNSSATTFAGVTQEGCSVLAGDTNPVARRTPFEGLDGCSGKEYSQYHVTWFLHIRESREYISADAGSSNLKPLTNATDLE
jgi:hypothetical protein